MDKLRRTTSGEKLRQVNQPQEAPELSKKGEVAGKYAFLEHKVTILKRTAQGIELVAKEPATMVTTVTTLGQGLVNLARLDVYGVLVGGVQVMGAGLSIRDAWNRVFPTLTGIDQLLADTQASVDAIGLCGNLNLEQAKSILENLAVLDKEYENLTARLKDIEAIVDYGDESIRNRKEKVASQIRNVLQGMNLARAEFAKAEEAQRKAKADLEIGKGIFTNMENQANSKVKDTEELRAKIVVIRELADDGATFCKKGIDHLTASQAAMDVGFAKLMEAQKLQLEALFELGALYAESRAVGEKIKEKAQFDKEAVSQKLNQIEDSTKAIIDNIETEFVMIEDIKENIEDIRKQMPGWTTAELAAALTIAALVPLGPGGRIVAATTFLQAWKNKESMRETIEGFFKTELHQQAPVLEGVLTFSFDKKSTGWVNRYYYGKPSATCGELKIDVGEGKTFDCRVNFNNKGGGISTQRLVELNELMLEGLKNDTIQPERCLEIVQQLRSESVSRGSGYADGHFITEDCPYLAPAERLAEKMRSISKH